MIDKWDIRFLEMAKFVSSWSKDPSTKVGSVIVNDKHRIISIGYNGLPAKNVDSNTRLSIREIKYKIILHAEINAILFANSSLENTTIYTWPFQPCSNCASVIIQSGIKRVVAPISTDERWGESFKLSKELFDEALICFDLIDLPLSEF